MEKIFNYFGFMLLCTIMLSCSKTTTPDPVVVTPPVTNSITPLLPSGWKKLPDFMGGSRANALSLTIGNKLYVGLGYNSNVGVTGVSNDFFEYDLSTNEWKKLENLPGEGRANAVSFVLNEKIYAGMGTNYNRVDANTIFKDFYEFDPKKGSWTKKNDFPFVPTDQPVSFVLGNKGYFGTGNTPANSPATKNNFYEYDATTDKWKSVASMPQSRCRGMAFVIDGKAYVGGGEDDNFQALNDFYEYDPVKNSWMSKKVLPVKISRSVGFSFNKSGFFIGGILQDGNFSENSIYKYNPTSDAWSKDGEIAAENDKKAGRFYPRVVNANDKIYIGLGSYGIGNVNFKDFYEFSIK